MTQTIVRVHPESIAEYGRQAQGVFDSIRATLEQLVRDVVDVRYFGGNAVMFKTQAGALAVDFANRLHADLAAMAGAVTASTTNIAHSLGGQPITITVNANPITAPMPVDPGFVDVDTSALSDLKGTVTARFEALGASLQTNLDALVATDWMGQAKVNAESQVGEFTSSAKAKCAEAQTSITDFITNQLTSVTSADA